MGGIFEFYGQYFDGPTLSALFIGLTGFFGIVFFLDALFEPSEEEKKEKELYGLSMEEKLYAFFSRFPYFEPYFNVLRRWVDGMSIKGGYMYIGLGILLLSASMGVYLVVVTRSYALAIGIPLFVKWFIQRILSYILLSEETQMQMQMPQVYMETMKELRRSGSVLEAIRNTSVFVKDPISRQLKSIAHRMRVQDERAVLTEAYHSYHNPWVKNYFGVLMRLVDSASISASMETLEYLKDKCTEKNTDLEEEITKTQEITMNGMMTAGTSVTIGIVATMIPAGREAYFRSSGMFLAYLFCWAIIFFSVYYIVSVNSVEGDDTKKDKKK